MSKMNTCLKQKQKKVLILDVVNEVILQLFFMYELSKIHRSNTLKYIDLILQNGILLTGYYNSFHIL